MIFDSIDKLPNYFPFKDFKDIITAINSIHLDSPDGVIELNNKNYIKVMSDMTRTHSDIIESHKEEVDIQILLKGREVIKVYDSKEVDVKIPYNPDIDCQFYSNPRSANNQLILKEGYFAVFYPQDIHNPLNAVGNVEELKKIVVKLNFKWLHEKMKYES